MTALTRKNILSKFLPLKTFTSQLSFKYGLFSCKTLNIVFFAVVNAEIVIIGKKISSSIPVLIIVFTDKTLIFGTVVKGFLPPNDLTRDERLIFVLRL